MTDEQMVWGNGCEDCGGLGARYEHRSTCRSDFCVGNGDFYDCGGTWVPCDGCLNIQAMQAAGLDCAECGGFVNLERLERLCDSCRRDRQAERSAIHAEEGLPF
jgi:hypothetical protein